MSLNELDIGREFPAEGADVYFNTAGATLVPRRIHDAVSEHLYLRLAHPARAYEATGGVRSDLHDGLAQLMKATPEEIAITHNTAAAVGILANGIDWQPGDVILTLNREYPSTVYPWMLLEKTRGVRLVMLEEHDGRVTEEEMAEAIRREQPKLVAISAVEWCSGWRFDLRAVGRACREAGALFFVDAAQSLGFCETDVRGCHISAMAGSSWKWLFGPPGLGYLYLRRGLLDEIRPSFVGPGSVQRAINQFDYELDYHPNMRRFEFSTMNTDGLLWFRAGVDFVRWLGLEDIRRHVFEIQDHARDRLLEMDCEIRGAGENPERRSGIMAFRHPAFDSAELSKRLIGECGIPAMERDGFVRLSMHVYSTPEGVDKFAAALNGLVDQGAEKH